MLVLDAVGVAWSRTEECNASGQAQDAAGAVLSVYRLPPYDLKHSRMGYANRTVGQQSASDCLCASAIAS